MKLKDLLFPVSFLLFLISGTCLLPVIGIKDATSPWLFSEYALTEITQEVLLLLLLAGSAFMAWKDKTENRSILILLSGLLACMLLRELDYFFDFIFHGAWKVPVLFVAGGTVGYVLRTYPFPRILSAAKEFCHGPHFSAFAFAMNTILVFSRLIGKRKLWQKLFDNVDQNVNHAVAPLLTAGRQGLDISPISGSGDVWMADLSNSWQKAQLAQNLGFIPEKMPPLMTEKVDFPAIEINFGIVKSCAEEITETYGYFLLFVATILYYFEWRKQLRSH